MRNTKSNLNLGKRKFVAECKEMRRIEQRIREKANRVNREKGIRYEIEREKEMMIIKSIKPLGGKRHWLICEKVYISYMYEIKN